MNVIDISVSPVVVDIDIFGSNRPIRIPIVRVMRNVTNRFRRIRVFPLDSPGRTTQVCIR